MSLGVCDFRRLTSEFAACVAKVSKLLDTPDPIDSNGLAQGQDRFDINRCMERNQELFKIVLAQSRCALDLPSAPTLMAVLMATYFHEVIPFTMFVTLDNNGDGPRRRVFERVRYDHIGQAAQRYKTLVGGTFVQR
jgi:hypothetical protein